MFSFKMSKPNMKKNITITNDTSLCPIKNAGFTLIELMVVIAIIAILTAIVLISFSGARDSSKMAKRYSDLGQIKIALEVYHNAKGKYPIVSGWGTECSAPSGLATVTTVATANDVIPGLAPVYLPGIPSDPDMNKSGGKFCYGYTSDASGVDFKVIDYNIVTMSGSIPPALVDHKRNLGTAWQNLGSCSSPSSAYSLAVWSSPTSECW